MQYWPELSLLLATAGLLAPALVPRLRVHRTLLIAGVALALIAALYPRPGNTEQYFFAGTTGIRRVPSEVFGIAFWLPGAWLLTNLLTFVPRRTLFPHDNQPHARRLVADLASGLIYVVARGNVTNHSHRNMPHIGTLSLTANARTSPRRVMDALELAAKGEPGLASTTPPWALACNFTYILVRYELNYPVDRFTLLLPLQSAMVTRVAETFERLSIPIGDVETAIRIVRPTTAAPKSRSLRRGYAARRTGRDASRRPRFPS